MTGPHYKFVWVAGMPRSGSMWTYNVARSLLRAAGRTIHPEVVPRTEDRAIEIAQAGIGDDNPDNVWCLKVHKRIRGDSPRSRFISNFRDPRDAIISYRRFVRCSFEQALTAATVWMELCDHYRGLPSDISLCLDYDDIDRTPDDVVARIDAFLELGSAPQTLADTVAEFSRDRVQKRLEAVQDDIKRRRAAGDTEIVDSLVANADGTVRALDPETGFQSFHVSDYRTGDWQTMLSPDEIGQMHAAFGDWLAKNGYAGLSEA